MNPTALWLIAVVLAVIGIVQVLQGQLIFGLVLLVAAAAVGPGGWSVFRDPRPLTAAGQSSIHKP